ncbi:COG1361 S-layer family protein [Methanosarcina sp. 2.H.A.1B.4]|uniref:COG1361 S-layer family protein n=1 Tax=Methanosarcina sp. 2.H.A.1B.4 TaxID=1483600 RepID=UPI0012E05B04|nr:COG1361 S-layer family protein [Methanosarcina sp. 2.H.A.1B.4]
MVLLISTTAFSSPAFALSTQEKGVTVDLLNQDPDPVKPGDILEVRISIQNMGYEANDNCIVKIEPKYPFKALPGEELSKNIGTLGKRSTDDREKVVKFKVGVENDINKGKYPLKVLFYSNEGKDKVSLTKDLMIAVDSESNAEIESISLERLVPGEKTNLTFGIKNVGNSPLKNAMFSWDCANDVILPVGSSNVKHINLIDVGETANVTFEVLTNVNTVPGLYKLDMTLTYDDVEALKTITEAGTLDNEKRKQIKSKAGVYIGGTTDFDISYMERSLTGSYTFSVSNIGNNAANSVKVSIPQQANWTIANGGSNSVVLGNLQKGDYTIADFNLKPAAYGKELPLKFEISYTSSDGQRQNEKQELSLYTTESPTNENSGSEESSTASFSYKLVLIVVLGIAGVLVYRKVSKKRKMNE